MSGASFVLAVHTMSRFNMFQPHRAHRAVRYRLCLVMPVGSGWNATRVSGVEIAAFQLFDHVLLVTSCEASQRLFFNSIRLNETPILFRTSNETVGLPASL